MPDKKRVKIERERSVIAYSEFWHASWCLFEQGKSQERGRYYQFMASLTFTAFTFEAYLNHLGVRLFKPNTWNGVERLNPISKLNAIAEELDLSIDFSQRPWQTLKKLFSFRNNMAHGKSISLKHEETIPLGEYCGFSPGGFLQTEWETFCSLENAERARSDVESIIRIIHEKRGDEEDFPFNGGHELRGASLIDD